VADFQNISFTGTMPIGICSAPGIYLSADCLSKI